jgi:hypothetical protein
MCGGIGKVKDENPRSNVIPRCCDWGFLSKAAVDSDVDKALTNEVLPLSTWPKIPMFTFKAEEMGTDMITSPKSYPTKTITYQSFASLNFFSLEEKEGYVGSQTRQSRSS